MPLVAALLLTLFGSAESPAADAPAWLRAAAAGPSTAVGSHAIVLLDESQLTVTDDGKLRTVRRYAVRVKSRDGRGAAALRHVYIHPSGKVKEVRGWIVGTTGAVRALKDEHVLDVAAVNNDVYNEVRVRAIGASEYVADGEVFGAEIEAEERLLFAQVEWPLQERWPVQVARRSLRLPAAWTATSVTFNAPAVQPTSEGGVLVWEARDLAPILDERGMPPLSAIAARVAVSFFGPGPARTPGQFETWDQVSAWLQALTAPASIPNQSVTIKARELTSDATTELDRASAIARYVQRVQYVSIQTGLGRGGGYQPRSPDVVLTKNYGDCKDKASLMRAMLAAVGIKSYLVSIFSGDRDYVRETWPSPQQFNHAIIAISLKAAPPEASMIEHEALGPLLMFDPTDEHTLLGELPLHEQGSLALIVAPGGGLRRMPLAGPERHGIVREMDAVLDIRGAVVAKIRETRRGADAVEARALRQSLDQPAYRQYYERHVTARIPSARLTRLDSSGEGPANSSIQLEVQAPAHGQVMGNLMIVKPLLGSDEIDLPAADASRRYPFVQQPIRREETIRLTLPAGTVIDEIPKPVALEGAFGRYSLSYTVEGAAIRARRSLEIPLKTVAPADQPRLREFLGQVRAADQSPIVLVQR